MLIQAVRRLLPGDGVFENTIKSGVWAALTTVLGRGFELIRLLVLAALLSPADFGLMGIALLCLAALQQFTELGVNDALVQNPDEDVSRYLDTAWVMNLVRGVALFGGLFLAAPLLADFFGEPRAADIIRVTALVPLIFGFQNPAIIYFQKNLEFHKRFVHQVGASFAGATVAIVYAVLYQSVWALVLGEVVREIALVVVSYLIDPYRPWPSFDLERARELYSFGKWITGLSILVFLTTQGDDAFVGWLLGATALGFYQFAYRLSNTPATQVSHVVSSVVFPAYSKVQDDLEALRDGYVRTLKLVTVVAVPMSVGIAMTVEPFIRGFIGEQWIPAILVIQILALAGLLRAIGATGGPLLKAVGRPDYATKVGAGKLVVIALLIYPASARYGIEGTAAVIVLSSLLVAEPAKAYVISQVIDFRMRDYLYIFGVPSAVGGVMALSLFAVRRFVPISGAVEFVVLVVVGAAVYLAVLVAVDRWLDFGLVSIVRSVVGSLT